MTPQVTSILLLTFAAIEIVLGLVLIFALHNLAVGASIIAMGCAGIAIAVSTRKKQING